MHCANFRPVCLIRFFLCQRRCLLLGAMACFSLAMLVYAEELPRHALVIGNSHYRTMPLENPENDARAMAQLLNKIGFHVTEIENASQKTMYEAIRAFGDVLRRGGVGLFYYAGHGVQVKGHNYLIPVDAVIEREDEVPYQSVDANQVLEKMETAKNPLNIVILDACRNNPFARGSRSASVGLVQMDAPVGSIIAFATAPGAEASDGTAKNGLYTHYLLKYMSLPGLKVEDVFKRVRLAVRLETQGKQIPWESTSLEGDFYFIAPALAMVTPPSPAPVPAPVPTPEPIRAAPQAMPSPQTAAMPVLPLKAGAKASPSLRCSDILQRAALGEPLTEEEAADLKKGCK